MSLIKWSPFLESFDDFENILSNYPTTRTDKNSFVPAIDMYEGDDTIIVETQLAGINSEKVNISIENDVLCIKGEGTKKSEVDDKNYYKKEIRRGSFYRSIQLPAHVDGDKASAKALDGVLKIFIPKIKESKSKIIKIETN